jgi:restriction system protein
MPIPDFQTIMLPIIQFLADGKEHPSAETISFLADSFKLTPEERSEMLAIGRQARFTNRVHWARIHLSKAGLIVAPRRGVYLINQAGQTLLATKPNRVDMRLLSDRYPDYEAFRRATTLSAQAGTPVTDDAQENPEEVMDSAYESRREALALELLDRMKGSLPGFLRVTGREVAGCAGLRRVPSYAPWPKPVCSPGPRLPLSCFLRPFSSATSSGGSCPGC